MREQSIAQSVTKQMFVKKISPLMTVMAIGGFCVSAFANQTITINVNAHSTALTNGAGGKHSIQNIANTQNQADKLIGQNAQTGANSSLVSNSLLNDAASVQTDDIDFSTLDNAPDPLADIEGLNLAKVPLNAISPETLKTFVTVIDTVRRQYVNETNDERLFRYAMSGMLKKLDTYAEFLDAEALTNLRAFTDGTVASVGLVANYATNREHWVVEFVVPESPSAKAGIKVGDYLHDIGGIRLNDTHTNEDIVQMLSGIAGTQLDVVVSHAGRGKHTVTLQRNVAESEGLSVKMENGVAVVRLPVFTNRTKDELVQSLARTNEPIFAVLIDVRNNPGGVLSSAIDVASLFMPNRPVVQVVARNQKNQTLNTTQNAPLQSVPVMIVQNRYSASAAEVLSAALLEGGAIVAGETSYGKGSVQSILPIGNEEAIKLTTAYYQMVDGTKIDGVGVIPNFNLNFDDEQWFERAMLVLQNTKKPAQGVLLSLSGDY